jgi:hypothetical protein
MGGNCAPTTMMGAGIDATTITLEHTSGTCEPVTFTITAGATSGRPAGTYTVNCTTPVDGPCIETDQKLLVPSIPSGNYQIHIRGKRAGVECYTNDDAMTVPPLGTTLTRTLNLGLATGC